MDINSCLTSKVYLVVMVLAILKAVIIYSAGRSHGSDEYEFFFPTLKEWFVIILLITALYIVGSMFLAITLGNKINKVLNQ